jgi:tripartite-type tricarboxylate transporter receptor subunit TctC
MTDLIGGTLSVFPAVAPLVSQHIQSGKAVGLAVFDTRRSDSLPNIPAVTEEMNVPGYVPTPGMVRVRRAGRHPAVHRRHDSTMINAVMVMSETKTRLASLGARSISVSNEQFAADPKAEYETAHALAKRLGTTTSKRGHAGWLPA